MEVDRAAEEVVFSELIAVAGRGEVFSVLSEESGLRSFGADYPLVLVDPVDGSLNAKQGVPVFGLMLAVGLSYLGSQGHLIPGELVESGALLVVIAGWALPLLLVFLIIYPRSSNRRQLCCRVLPVFFRSSTQR